MNKTAPSPYKTIQEAAKAIADQFILDNIGSQPDVAADWLAENLHRIETALILDGDLPNEYEVEALAGLVPIDGSDPEEIDVEDVPDFGCPEEVSKKFSNVNEVIESQF